MEQEKLVDLKFSLDDEIKRWYLNEFGIFYLLVNSEGDVLYFSEDSLNFFLSIDNYDNYSIKDLIGQSNWFLLKDELVNNHINNELYFFSEPVNGRDDLGVLWKSFGEPDDLKYFLLFKKKEIVKEAVVSIEKKEEDASCYKEAIGLLENPVALIKDNDFFYKNSFFDNFMLEKSINGISNFLDWVNSNKSGASLSFLELNDNAQFGFSDERESYFISVKPLSASGVTLLCIKESDVYNEEMGSSDVKLSSVVEDISAVEDDKLKILKNDLLDLKNNAFSEHSKKIDDFEVEVGDSLESLKEQHDEYRQIIDFTSKNLLKMSEVADFIDEISVKIHLISINAAIEAARSGEVGKGFTVISREIAKLSDITKDYTKMINAQIDDLRKSTESILNEGKTSDGYSEKVLFSLKKLKDNVKTIFRSIESQLGDYVANI